MARECAYWDRAVADAFGFHAVQCGLPELDLLRNNRIPWRITVGNTDHVGLRAESTQLPFANQSVDLLLLPHVLDFSDDPHQVLREALRVLVPEGRLIVTGFNPLSLWGVRRALQQRRFAPWEGRFFSLARIKDWLSLLNLEPSGGAFMCYAPPLDSQKWLDRFAFMEDAGDRWWPLAAGIYAIEAVKRVRGMRLLTPKWTTRLAPRLSVVGSEKRPTLTARDQHDQKEK